MPNDDTQPWNRQVRNIFYISLYLVCVVMNKYILRVSVCSPGQFDLEEDVG